MTTAIDSSVLIAILKGEPGAEAWVRTLAHARAESRLVICDAVYAESSQALDTRDDFEAALTRLGIEFDPV